MVVQGGGLVLTENSLTCSIDDKGNVYRIPICVINDPDSYEVNTEAEILSSKMRPLEREVSFFIRQVGSPDSLEIIMSNMAKVRHLKEYYKQEVERGGDEIRLFAYGKEMRDEFSLYHYAINDDVVIIVK